MLKYKFKKIRKRKLVVWCTFIFLFLFSLGSIVRFYAIASFDGQQSNNIIGDTVYVNDLEADWNYFTSLNYTKITSKTTLPTYTEIYNTSNLVAVQINYDGRDINHPNLVGYVSHNEHQSQFVYYKYYPIDANGYVTIELIDNPYTARPTGYGFNGWVCDAESTIGVDCTSLTFSYDDTYYTRSVKVKAPTNAGDKKMFLSLRASWVTANIITPTSGTFTSEFTKLYNKGMQSVGDISVDDGLLTTGYYYQITNYNNTMDKELYYNNQGISCASTTCSSTAYKLIQSLEDMTVTYSLQEYESYIDGEEACTTTIDKIKYCQISSPQRDADGNIVYAYDEDGNLTDEIVYEEKTVLVNTLSSYYYLVTRDTNIVSFRSGSIAISNLAKTKPFTISGAYNDVDTGSGQLTNNNNGSLSLSEDLVIENIRITGPSVSTSSTRSTNYLIYANYNNLKIGRGVFSATEYMAASGIVGGSSGNSSATKKNKVIVESGHYQYLKVTSNQSITDERMIAWYGSDYDRVTGNNENLTVEYQALASDSGNHNSTSITPTSQMVIKSGVFGNYIINGNGSTSSNSYYTYGVYAGGISSGSSTSYRVLKIEGGRIFSVNGGPCISNSNTVGNVIGIYMTGGEVDNIVGGAGTSETYGNRIVSVTGGTVNNAVAGGSNSYSTSGKITAGPFRGNTLVYIGGSAVIGGTPATVERTGTLYAVTAGSVFGAGLGSNGQANRGVAYSTHVIINGGTIKNNVYGGGNYGAAGYNTNATATIDVLDGTVEGSVFGGANSNGFGTSTNYTYTINLNMSGGTVGYLYGGSNSSGTVYGNVNINITGGTVVNDVFGGGYGSSTIVYGNIKVNTKTNNDSLLNISNVYGGSANGQVNRTSSNTTDVTIDGGTISGDVYGAGKGETATPTTNGNITVKIENGNISRVFGGNNIRGTLTQTGTRLQVIVDGGEMQEVFGGSNGANAGATETNVTINGGRIFSAVYGGGNEATTTTSHVTVNGGIFAELDTDGYLIGEAGEVFGGGYAASVTTTNVNIENGANVYNVYGGSNEQGLVTTSNVNNNGGTVLCNTYGGGNIAEVTTSNNNLNGTNYGYKLKDGETIYNTSCGNAYGGGAKADVSNANITLNGSTLLNVYGGSNQAGTVTSSHVVANHGDVKTVFGGNNAGGTTVNSSVSVDETNGTLSVINVFGGSNGSGAISESTTVALYNGTVTEDIFGGGNEAKVLTSTEVNMYGGTVRNLYGGGNQSFVGDAVVNSNGEYLTGNTTGATVVNIANGTITHNVYGSGNASFVYGSTEINIGDRALENLALASDFVENKTISIAGSVFGGSETNSSEDIQFNYQSQGVIGDATLYIKGKEYSDTDHTMISIAGSIYGSGNNSITSGISTLYYENMGTESNPVRVKSLQRLTNTYITDSHTMFTGDRDRAAGTVYKFALIRLTHFYLLGSSATDDTLHGSTIYFGAGATYLSDFNSGTMNGNYGSDSFVEETVTNQDGVFTKENADNKIFMLVNTVLSVSNSSEPYYDSDFTLAGPVNGMTYLGMYKLDGSKILKGIYDTALSNSSSISSEVVSEISDKSYTFVYGKHEFDPEVQIVSNGYYTNVYDEDSQSISSDYVGVTPTNALYYKWIIGEEPTDIEVNLQASRYSVDGVLNKTISLDELREIIDGETSEWRDAVVTINSVDTSEFQATTDVTQEFDGILVDKNEIPTINTDDKNGDGVVDANNYFALSMGTTSAGWLSNYKTNFYDPDQLQDTSLNKCNIDSVGSCTGDAMYLYDSTTVQRSLSFWLYHSKNLDFSYNADDKEENPEISMGKVYIYTSFRNPHGDPTSATSIVSVRIVVNISLYEGDKDAYGSAISPGKKYEVFQKRPTSIPSDGSFSIYQSLSLDLTKPMLNSKDGELWSVEKVYPEGAYRYLASSYGLPVGTMITMLDIKDGKQYYYEIDEDAYTAALAEYNQKGRYQYYLDQFIQMGSTDLDNTFDNDTHGANSTKYYYTEEKNGKKEEFAVEEFIFSVDFSGVKEEDRTTEPISNAYFYLQLSKDEDGVEKMILGPNGIPEEEMIYSINPDVQSSLDVSGGYVSSSGALSPSTSIYVGESTTLHLDTSLIQKNSDGTLLTSVTDTRFDDYKLGVKMSIVRPKLDSSGNAVIEDGQPVYEPVTTDLMGATFEINGESYYPQTDGSVRLELAGRVTNISLDIGIDFGNSAMSYGDYVLVVETFASYDGLYYGDFTPTYNEFPFVLLNNQYGLNVSIPSVSVTHDVNTGLDSEGKNEILYTVKTLNGLENPNLKISLQRRSYDDVYDTSYVNVDLKNIATKVSLEGTTRNQLDSCYSTDDTGMCLYYNLGDIIRSLDENTYMVSMELKEGPDSTDLNDKANAKWKSGTYRVVFTMFDGDVAVGEVYEYLIIRNLDVDE